MDFSIPHQTHLREKQVHTYDGAGRGWWHLRRNCQHTFLLHLLLHPKPVHERRHRPYANQIERNPLWKGLYCWETRKERFERSERNYHTWRNLSSRTVQRGAKDSKQTQDASDQKIVCLPYSEGRKACIYAKLWGVWKQAGHQKYCWWSNEPCSTSIHPPFVRVDAFDAPPERLGLCRSWQEIRQTYQVDSNEAWT